jgi:hypothetical protein
MNSDDSNINQDESEDGEENYEELDDATREAMERHSKFLRKLARGGPWMYRWSSPIGEFQIQLMPSFSGRVVWNLQIDYREIGTYKDYIDAMLAVCNQTTGWSKWDTYSAGPILPKNSKDWREVY